MTENGKFVKWKDDEEGWESEGKREMVEKMKGKGENG